MIATKKALPRRTVLRGIGAALALPLLDGMVPALTALGRTVAKPTTRFGAIYVPNGIMMDRWTPAAEGSGFAVTPILKPLEGLRDRVLVISGLDNTGSASRTGNGGGHAKTGGAWLTGVEPLATTGTARLELGISMDQIVAQALGQDTALPSLELSLEGDDVANGVGSCDPGYSCTYQNTVSWRNATTPMPMEANPRTVFERLFGDIGSTDPAVRRARIQRERSILDSVSQTVGRLARDLGPSDRRKLDEYLESVREIERRIQNAEAQGARELPVIDSPVGIPVSYDEHARLMFDLQVLAYQTDVTRVVTFQIGREQSGTTYPQIGVPDSHHPISHYGTSKKMMADLAKINVYHMSLVAQFLEKLQATPDGDGSLLDHAMILYGAGMSDPNEHSIYDLPVLVAGGCAGQIKGGRHIRYPKGTPLPNLQLTLLHKLGVREDKFGVSTGPLTDI